MSKEKEARFEMKEVRFGFMLRCYKGLTFHVTFGLFDEGYYTLSHVGTGGAIRHSTVPWYPMKILHALAAIHDWEAPTTYEELMADKELSRKVDQVAREHSIEWLNLDSLIKDDFQGGV